MIRFIPTHYGGTLYRKNEQIGFVKRINNEPNYKFFSLNKSYSWEEMDDICHIVWEIEHGK